MTDIYEAKPGETITIILPKAAPQSGLLGDSGSTSQAWKGYKPFDYPIPIPNAPEIYNRRARAKLDESRKLTGRFTDYLTGLEPSGEWKEKKENA